MAKVYYRKNVNYFVGVRMNLRDSIGKVLSSDYPDIGVNEEDIRDFKIANKRAIMDGLIVPTTEPTIDWETSNVIEDEEIRELVKSYLKLKARLAGITSLSMLEKILNIAKEENKSPKILALIEGRIEEVAPEIDDPSQYRGVE